jgi:hypothetical protein
MKNLTWQTVGLLGILAATAVALASLTTWGSAEIIALVGILGGIGTGAAVGGAVAGGVSQRVDQLQAETTAQTGTLATIERRTNGELDQRIAAAMEDAAETGSARTLAELRRQGVIR